MFNRLLVFMAGLGPQQPAFPDSHGEFIISPVWKCEFLWKLSCADTTITDNYEYYHAGKHRRITKIPFG